jgi:hypothetical protein
MDKNKARKMYELADRLSKVDTSKLNEQQLVEHTGMIKRLGQELKIMKEGAAAQFSPEMHDRIKNATPQQLGAMAHELAGPGSSYAMYQHELKMLQQAQAELKGMTEGFKGPEQEVKVRARLKQLEDTDPDNMYKIVADEFDMTEEELRDALHDERGVAEASEEDLHTSYNVVKMSGALEVDPRTLRTAIARSMKGNPTRSDTMTLANAFLNLLKNSDDNAIQQFANLIKSGNPRAVPQESTAAVAEANAFVDAMRQVKKGEKFTVGGKEFTKTTTHGDDNKVDEAISTEAYDRLKRVFDFSNFKG